MIVTKNPVSPESVEENLILFEAFRGNANLAKALSDKFNVNEPVLAARLSYLSGEFEKAFEQAQIAKDIYLQCEILTATNKFSEALSLIKNEPLNSVYFYYSGVIYIHTQEFKKAIACLEKAYDGFSEENHKVRKLMTLANLAVALNASGEISKASEVFDKAIFLINRADLRKFPRFCSKFFVSYGFQLMQSGSLYRAYKFLKIAEKIIGSNRSEEYFRCQVFLGYVLKQLGYFSKAIQILERLEIKVKYLELDRLRYLAECYLQIGNLEKSEQLVHQAIEKSEFDKFAQIFLNLISYQIHTLKNENELTKTLFERIEQDCIETHDEISLSFVRGKKACLTNDVTVAKIEAERLSFFGFRTESLECSLVLVRHLISLGEYQTAIARINKSEAHSFPCEYFESLLLKALCNAFMGRKLDRDLDITIALKFAKGRKNYFQIAKAILVQIYTDQKLSSIMNLTNEYLETLSYLEPWQQKNLDNFMFSLNCQINFNVKIKNAFQQLSLNQFIEHTRNELGFILETENQRLIYRGHFFEELKEFPVQWNLVKILVDFSNTRPLTKELFANQVLGRANYNALVDDNNINVTLHRLRRTLKKIFNADPIVNKQGNYFLNSKYSAVILESVNITTNANRSQPVKANF